VLPLEVMGHLSYAIWGASGSPLPISRSSSTAGPPTHPSYLPAPGPLLRMLGSGVPPSPNQMQDSGQARKQLRLPPLCETAWVPSEDLNPRGGLSDQLPGWLRGWRTDLGACCPSFAYHTLPTPFSHLLKKPSVPSQLVLPLCSPWGRTDTPMHMTPRSHTRSAHVNMCATCPCTNM
jgi:hypothetical protein